MRSTAPTLVGVVVLLGMAAPARAATSTGVPGEGVLFIATDKAPEGASEFPLKHTEVKARILGFTSQVRVRQTFANPFTAPLEAIYVFPLPDDAAVGAMSIQIGDRTVRGIIKTRDEARRIYEKAKREGKTAARLDQERPNIFTQYVANIEPGKQVVVDIVYDVRLDYAAGEYEFVYPMVVGPRYMPGAPVGKQGGGWSPDTDQVPDASKISPPVRKPGTRSGHEVSVEVIIEPGMAMQKLWSPTHKIEVGKPQGAGPHTTRVALAAGDRVPNEDFVLRYRLATEKPAMAVLAESAAEGGGHLALLFEPPAQVAPADVTPKEIYFIVDTSGSMSGEPIALVKRAMRHAIANLDPRDSFQIVRFSDSPRSMAHHPQPATPDNVRRALSWINGIDAGGGTEMMGGVRAALAGKDPARLRIVCFMTDGYVGNDVEILGEIERLMDDNTRLFSFGVGSSVNRFLLDRMAEVGRGAVSYILLDDNPQQQVETFYARMRSPVLTHVDIDWGRVSAREVMPRRIPDLFAGQPVSVVARYDAAGEGTVTIKGRIAGKPVRWQVPVTLVAGGIPGEPRATAAQPQASSQARTGIGPGAIGRMWARARIEALSAQMYRGEQPEVVDQITRTALAYALVSKYTSFVAVDENVVNESGVLKTYQVPVEMPAGVSYEGVFGGGEDGDDEDEGGEVYATGAGGMAPMAEMIAVRHRRLFEQGAWRFSLGLGLGTGSVGDQRGLAAAIDGRAGWVMPADLVAQVRLGLMLLRGDDVDRSLGQLVFELVWIKLRLIELSAGGGLTFGDELAPTLGGALDIRLPFRTLSPSLEARYQNVIIGGEPNPSLLTFGLQLSF